MQQRDRYQSIEDFLADDSFKAWVLTGQDPDQWEAWTVEHPQRSAIVENARNLWLAMQVPDPKVTPEESVAALQSTWQKIVQAEDNVIAPTWRWWRSAAAVLLLGCGISLAWYIYRDIVVTPGTSYTELIENTSDPVLERTNDTDHPLLITLADGSSVLLQPDSKLSFPAKFEGRERKVYLSGEAFFEVSKNPNQPFLVYANELLTRVVGTSFRVKAFADQDDIEVVVRTGKVNVSSSSVAADSSEEELLLLPNQGVRFSRERLAFEKIDDLTQEKQISQKLSNIERLSFEFSDVPVAQIFKTIEQAYLVEIDFPEEKLKNCYLTTSLSDEPLPQKLKIICSSLGPDASYAIEGNKISVSAKGCD
ncbi:FecR family protein [Persicitalea jodogahamensis]|uniref:FecR family protein n=1 Tax=Persicitalea jodogahamensis TaxID=402147 RepID=UPI00167B4D4C|nr:FecR family protein [Persicitalea jodogahamensis]